MHESEKKAVAACFGQKTLRGITERDLLNKAGELRRAVSDRAVMRAFHFVRENDRVPQQVAALRKSKKQILPVENGPNTFRYVMFV